MQDRVVWEWLMRANKNLKTSRGIETPENPVSVFAIRRFLKKQGIEKLYEAYEEVLEDAHRKPSGF